MAKKNKSSQTDKPVVAGRHPPAQALTATSPANTSFLAKYSDVLIPVAIAVVVWLFLNTCLNDGITNWDDPGYIKDDKLVRDISWNGIKHIFSLSAAVQGNYHPLTILSYAIEYSLVSLQPWLYHFDSLAIHIGVTLLVYYFVVLLTGRRVAAAITALLFGLHPMHMESVAWLSGRKDVIYGFFYMAACIAYLYYVRTAGSKRWKWYTAVIVLFICSLLAKPVAVVLPITLLLIDLYERRKLNFGLLLEKIPHFAIAIVFGIKSVMDQRTYGALKLQGVTYSIIDRISLGSHALVTYLWKAVAPVALCCFYPYPEKLEWVSFAIMLIIIALVGWFGRKSKIVVFGSLFFLINMALLLQFIPVGDAIVAERYTYIPYIGLFFILGWYVSGYFQPGANRQTGYMVLSAVLAYSLFLGYLANERCQVWYSTVSLWNDEIDKQPQSPNAYNNLGFDYFTRFDVATNPNEKRLCYDSSYYLLSKAIAIKPDYQSPYITIGDLERTVGKYAEAKRNYYMGLSLKKKDDEYAKAYMGLGIIYAIGNNFDSSLFCFRSSLGLTELSEAHSNFGNLYAMLGKHDSSLIQYSAAIAMRPDGTPAYLNRGRELQRLHRYPEAMKDLDKALSLSPNDGEIYYARSLCNAENGNRPQALADVEKAVSLGYRQVDQAYYQGLKR